MKIHKIDYFYIYYIYNINKNKNHHSQSNQFSDMDYKDFYLL